MHEGDLLLIEQRGDRFYVMAGLVGDGTVACRPLGPGRSVRTARAYEVVGHWRASAETRRAMEENGNAQS